MKQNGTVFVTGGAGFIGSALSRYLTANFAHVVAIDNLHSQVHPTGNPALGFHRDVDLIKGDVTDPQMWDHLLTRVKPKLLIHLAAETGTGQSLTESTRHTTVNIVGTSLMLDKLQEHDAIPEKILLCSSRAVYGEGLWQYDSTNGKAKTFAPKMRTKAMLENRQWDFPGAQAVPMNAQSTPVHPESVYGVTKLAQENLITLWADAFDVQAVILRLQNVYGAGQTPANPYTGIMSLFTNLARTGQVIPLYEDGEVRRDFIYIDDVVKACIAAIETPHSLPCPIDIGSGHYTTLREAAAQIAALYDAPAPKITGQYRHGDVRHAWADSQLAEKYLGFKAEIDFAQGVARLAKWIDATSEESQRGE